MGHIKQVEYNKRWRHNRKEHYNQTRRKNFVWKQVSSQFRKIGIYDLFPESRGVKIY